MKFRKRPVEIDAVQYAADGSNVDDVLDWIALGGGKAQAIGFSIPFLIEIQTLEGRMTASPEDWVIRGVKGEYFACKPDIFSETYEAA